MSNITISEDNIFISPEGFNKWFPEQKVKTIISVDLGLFDEEYKNKTEEEVLYVSWTVFKKDGKTFLKRHPDNVILPCLITLSNGFKIKPCPSWLNYSSINPQDVELRNSVRCVEFGANHEHKSSHSRETLCWKWLNGIYHSSCSFLHPPELAKNITGNIKFHSDKRMCYDWLNNKCFIRNCKFSHTDLELPFEQVLETVPKNINIAECFEELYNILNKNLKQIQQYPKHYIKYIEKSRTNFSLMINKYFYILFDQDVSPILKSSLEISQSNKQILVWIHKNLQSCDKYQNYIYKVYNKSHVTVDDKCLYGVNCNKSHTIKICSRELDGLDCLHNKDSIDEFKFNLKKLEKHQKIKKENKLVFDDFTKKWVTSVSQTEIDIPEILSQGIVIHLFNDEWNWSWNHVVKSDKKCNISIQIPKSYVKPKWECQEYSPVVIEQVKIPRIFELNIFLKKYKSFPKWQVRLWFMTKNKLSFADFQKNIKFYVYYLSDNLGMTWQKYIIHAQKQTSIWALLGTGYSRHGIKSLEELDCEDIVIGDLKKEQEIKNNYYSLFDFISLKKMEENKKLIGSDQSVLKALPDLFERYKIDLKQNGYLKTKSFTNWINSNEIISKSIETFFEYPKSKFPKIEYYWQNNIDMDLSDYLQKDFNLIKKWHIEYIKNKTSWDEWLAAKNKLEYDKIVKEDYIESSFMDKIAKAFIQEAPEKISHKEKMALRKKKTH